MKVLKKLFKKNKQQYIVLFAIQDGNFYKVQEKRVIEPETTQINYDKNHTYTIDTSQYLFQDENKTYLLVDINAEQVLFHKKIDNDKIVSPKVNNMVLVDSVIEQLAKASKQEKQKFDLTALFLGLAIGGLLGFIIKIFIQLPV